VTQSLSFAMNTPLLPEILLRRDYSPQADLDLATEGVLRYVWSSAWGNMLIEARDGAVYVNGEKVDAVPATSKSSTLSDTNTR
jgi:hypothetical protein